jgi:hypothetical protein
MTPEERQILEEIREQNREIQEQNREILAALRRGGLLPCLDKQPERRRGEPSMLELMTEAQKMAQIYDTEGPAAMKAAMKLRNEEARQRRRRSGRSTGS